MDVMLKIDKLTAIVIFGLMLFSIFPAYMSIGEQLQAGQVTGIRQDPYANAHPIQVEEDKPDKERGYYLHPDVYGQPEENGISNLLFPKDKREGVLARAVHK
jgi:hypothetical protein